jgi:hypothetical protein
MRKAAGKLHSGPAHAGTGGYHGKEGDADRLDAAPMHGTRIRSYGFLREI